jgi:single-strand DNA-binding protein
MNLVVIKGRLSKDPDIRYSAGEEQKAIARFTVAVDRYNSDADFISVVAFGKKAEVIEKYFHKGSNIIVKGSIKTGSYTNKEGQKVYTTDVVLDELEFCDSKKEQPQQADGFLDVPDSLEDESLPF